VLSFLVSCIRIEHIHDILVNRRTNLYLREAIFILLGLHFGVDISVKSPNDL